jgi:type II secretory pathway pseudopilin PulG
MQNLRKTNETGRSMLEMLGVLAIVGVLSAGGVYGYGVAMKKHKANELLHQASIQASSIATQIASGKTDLALENFGNSSNGSFSSVKGPDGSTDYQSGDDKFTMQITGMDEAVCEQMQGMKGGTVRSVSCSAVDANGKVTATLAFNKDLSSTPVASDYNDDTTGKKCEDAGHKWCDGKCKTDCCDGKCTTGQTCVSGSCMNAECKNEDCSCSNQGKNSIECSAEKPYCLMNDPFSGDGVCDETAEGKECFSVNYFCSGTDAPYCNYDTGKCSKTPEGMVCTGQKDCVVGFCRLDKCWLTAKDFDCMSDSECTGTDYPYCDFHKNKCSKVSLGTICYPDRSVCKGTDTPYCVNNYCSSNPEGAICNSPSDCGDGAPYCVNNYCSSNPEGAICNSPSDCGDSAPYCINEKCSKSSAGKLCSSHDECKDTDAPYCVNEKCSKSSAEKPCSSHGDCKDTDAKYCVLNSTTGLGECATTAVGRLCLIPSDCVGTDAPYCNASNICSKTQEYGGFCNPGQDCGPGLSCGSEGRCI